MAEPAQLSVEDARLWALALPKAEQHVHDVGSMPVDMLRGFAEKYNLLSSLPPGLAAGSYSFEGQGLPAFVAMYVAACEVLTSGDDYFELGRRISHDQRAQNTRYSRVQHTPAIPGARDGLWDEPLAGLLAGFREGFAEGGAFCNVLIDIPAEFDSLFPGNDFRERTLEVALKHMVDSNPSVPGVVAVGVAGDESKRDFVNDRVLLQGARDSGLDLAVHAGESQLPKSMWDALNVLDNPVQRIEHGIAAVLDDDLVRKLCDAGVPLDMAITSNFALGNLDQLGVKDHPFLALLDAGVEVTLSTDDPTMFRTDLCNEFAAAARLGANKAQLCRMARNGWNDRFAPEALRKQALADIDTLESQDAEEVVANIAADAKDAYRFFAERNETTLTV